MAHYSYRLDRASNRNDIMKTYEAIFNPGKSAGVYGISLVENPAMEGHFIKLSEEEQKRITLKTIDEEQRILIGLVLEPNKPIYRNQDGEEFNVLFSEETIKELAYEFYKGGFHKNSSVEHSNKIEGVTFVESWIVADSEKDKSSALGLSYPKGSWMATMKVDSEDVWSNYVSTGKVKGFSVDALVSLKEVNLKKEIKMSNNTKEKSSIAEAIKEGFAQFMHLFNEKKMELGKQKTEDGQVEVNFEGDTLEAGASVWILSEDGTEVPLPKGEYILDDKKILVVTEEGKAGEIKDAPEETKTEETTKTEMSKEEGKAITEAVAAAVNNVMMQYSKDQEKRIAALEQKIVTLSEQPAKKPINGTPQQTTPNTAKSRILAEIQNT